MNRNTDDHFGNVPSKNMRRSKFKRDCTYSTTINAGEIGVMYTDEVLPGDTVKLHLNELIRMTTPIYPVLDNSWIDTYFFFVPRRLVWTHWKEFMGENTTDAWTQETQYQIPQLTSPEGGWEKGTIAHMIGARMNTDGISIDACYTRAYTLIFNEWFRNQNVTEPAELSTGDATTAGSNGTDYVTDLQKGGKLAKAVKYADYFTRALPEPQKGPDIYIPIGLTGMAPVIPSYDGDIDFDTYRKTFPTGTNPYTKVAPHNADNSDWGTSSGNMYLQGQDGLIHEKSGASGGGEFVGFKNMFADLSELPESSGAQATINQLRQAFAVQRMYELDARGGTRYTEILRMHFGVLSPDGRQQRPEYLGGKRVPINIKDVIQNSSTDATTPQGNTAGMSKTIDSTDMFTKSFTEHGILMGLFVIRTEHTYQQGIPRILSRKNRMDFYWPALANIGEMYIKNKELYAQGTDEDEEAFGYQEAWSEYRYGINRITNELNSDYNTPLDSWTYADKYETLPTLSDEWIRETDANVARTLAINSQDQFLCNFYFDQTWIRPMPIYSVPSLTGWN